ncbi:pseudouridine synthase [Virgibacillus salexigens]|uniref:pseudouridine synthase n=1 Tax=Virgibacillus TaxID=84406 RepID=UPI001371131D|nr:MULTISPECIES: 16S rRNA pseudouridine(516) synthase [Virgibacillus]MYL41464.1 pseudouridine synthase [Virgibacillus massiliensis]
MRIDKFLANTGYGSRKDVKVLLKKKQVFVNGSIVKNSALHINPYEDMIKVNDTLIKYRKYIYMMMNKPPQVISATEDKRDKTVIDLLPPALQNFQPFPVGRLDKDTEGLLLITNDGKMAHHLLSPKKNIDKTYYAKIDGIITENDITSFRNGIQLNDGYVTKPAGLSILHRGEISEVLVTITEGKFHQVKRMFHAIDKPVIYLKRMQMGRLKLDQSLALGEYRELTEEELQLLNNP